MITSFCNLGRETRGERGDSTFNNSHRGATREKRKNVVAVAGTISEYVALAEDNCLENVFQAGENLRR